MVDLTRFAFPQGRFPQRQESSQGGLLEVLGAFGAARQRSEQQQLQRQELERAIDQRRNLAEDLRIFTGEPLVVGGRVGPVEGGREVVDVAQPTEKNRAQALARIMSLDPELGKNLQNIEKINQELAISADENARANFNQSLKQSETSAKFGASAALQMKETPTLEGKRKLAKEAMTNIDALGLDPQFTEELKEDLQAIVNAENIDTANTKINGIIALGVPTADILSSIQEEQKQLTKDFTEQQNQATIGQGVIDLLGNRSLEEVPENLKFLKQQVDAIKQLNPNNPNDRVRLNSKLVSLGRTMQQFPKLFEGLQQFGTQEQFVPVEDDQGNIVAQQNTQTGRVFPDPRAPSALPAKIRLFNEARAQGLIGEDVSFMEFLKSGSSSVTVNNIKLPSGFRFIDPEKPELGIEPIPGGPADRLSGEAAGKAQLLRTAQEAARNLDRFIFDEDGSVDRVNLFNAIANTPFTEGRELRAKMEAGIQGITRIETGAAMPPGEVENTRLRFQPSPFDSDKLVRLKLELFRDFMEGNLKLLDPTGRFNEDRFQTELQKHSEERGVSLEPEVGRFKLKDQSSGQGGQQIGRFKVEVE